MKNPRKRAFSNSSDSESDSENEGDFRDYIKRKSAAVQKALPAQTFDLEDGIVSKEQPKDTSKRPASSKVLSNFKESKKQRDLDKLYSESLKAQLERESESPALKDKESFVTKAYEDRRRELDGAAQLASKEQQSDVTGGANAYNFQRIYLVDKEEEGSGEGEQQIEGSQQIAEIPKVYENDVYVANRDTYKRDVKISPKLHQLVGEPRVEIKSLVMEFLTSGISNEEIELQKKQYFERSGASLS